MKDKLSWFLMAVILIIMVFGQVMSKLGAGYDSLFNVFVLLGYSALFLRAVIWIFVLKRLPISAAYPIMSLSFVLVLGASHFIFAEEITLFKAAGSILIIIGIILTSMGNRQNTREQDKEVRN